MTVFDVIYAECQGCPSPGTWQGWSSSIYSLKNSAQTPSCSLPAPARLRGTLASASFHPSRSASLSLCDPPHPPSSPFMGQAHGPPPAAPHRHAVPALPGWPHRRTQTVATRPLCPRVPVTHTQTHTKVRVPFPPSCVSGPLFRSPIPHRQRTRRGRLSACPDGAARGPGSAGRVLASHGAAKSPQSQLGHMSLLGSSQTHL